MPNPIRFLLPVAAWVALAAPLRAVETVTLRNQLNVRVEVQLAHLGRPGEATLILQEFPLDGGDAPGQTKRVDLGAAKFPELPLGDHHDLEIGSRHAPGTAFILPISISGTDPDTSEAFTIDFLLSSRAGRLTTEVELKIDPASGRKRLPFQVLLMEPDPDAEEELAGYALVPYGSSGKLHHRLRSMPNMSSVSSMKAETQERCTCVIL